MSGGGVYDVPDGFAYSRAHLLECMKIFGAKSDLELANSVEKENIPSGERNGLWLLLQAPSACQSICLDWRRACAGRSHECSVNHRATCHGPMGGVGGLRRAYKMSGGTPGDVIAFKRFAETFQLLVSSFAFHRRFPSPRPRYDQWVSTSI